jgi:hypothetical protein
MSGFPISSSSQSINSIEKISVTPKQDQNKTLPQNTTSQAPSNQSAAAPKDNIQMKTGNLNTTNSNVASPVSNKISASFEKGLSSKNQQTQSTTTTTNKDISPTGAREFSRDEAKKIIKAAQEHGKKMFPNNPSAAADEAWGWSLQKRNNDPKDVNWAAAEHYLYAKSVSKESAVGAVTMGVLAAGYDVVKAGLFAVGREDLLSTTGKAEDISKPTLGSAISGIEGAYDGLIGN